jgi:hypothetical protein
MMSISRSVGLGLAFTLFACPTEAADLTKIARTIAKEPAYKGKPTYCLLVIGPEARTRVWLAMDDNCLYVDRNGDGDLTATGNRVRFNEPYGRWESGDIRGPEGKLRYRLSLRRYTKAISGVKLFVKEEGKKGYIAGDPDGEPLVFGASPSQAPVVHVGGPLVTDLSYYGQGTAARSLVLRVRVGTRGLGQGAFAAVLLPDKVFPVAEIEFPSGEPGKPAMATKKTLKNR